MKRCDALFAGILVFGLALGAGAATTAVPSSSETYKNQPHAHVLNFKHHARLDKGQILNPGEKAPTTTFEKSNKELGTPTVMPSSAAALVPSAVPKN